jgi:hypothetical protein
MFVECSRRDRPTPFYELNVGDWATSASRIFHAFGLSSCDRRYYKHSTTSWLTARAAGGSV